jgi:hypothetical protein
LKVTGYDVHLNRDPNRDVKAQLKPGGWKAEEKSLGLRKVISSRYVSIRVRFDIRRLRQCRCSCPDSGYWSRESFCILVS